MSLVHFLREIIEFNIQKNLGKKADIIGTSSNAAASLSKARVHYAIINY